MSKTKKRNRQKTMNAGGASVSASSSVRAGAAALAVENSGTRLSSSGGSPVSAADRAGERSKKSFELVLTAMFTAIILLMAYIPFLGYIPLVGINATIIHIPVTLGALFLGPKKGGFLGFVFGLTSFLNNTIRPATASAFVFSPVLAYNQFGVGGVFKSTFICFVPRILVGVVPFFVYALVSKKARRGFSLAVAGFSGAFTNTLLVMGSIYILYRESYALALGTTADKLLNIIMGIVSLNGSVESVLAAFLVTVIGGALLKLGLGNHLTKAIAAGGFVEEEQLIIL